MSGAAICFFYVLIFAFSFVGIGCSAEEISRELNAPFPADCVPLAFSDNIVADELLKQMSNTDNRAVALESLNKLIHSDELKAYAWWRWRQERLSEKEIKENSAQYEALRNLLILPSKTLFHKNGLLKACYSYYFLKDGSRVFHGPFIDADESGFLRSCGEFRHGYQHGRWRLWENPKKPYADGIWDNGVPIQGTIELSLDGDKTIQEFSNGKIVTVTKKSTYKPHAVIINPGMEDK